MSKNPTTDQIIPQNLNDRLLYLRTEWRKTKRSFDKNQKKFSELKKLVYFLRTVDKQDPSYIAELLGVKPPRINTIMREIKSKKEVKSK